jgi:hypothetical protein
MTDIIPDEQINGVTHAQFYAQAQRGAILLDSKDPDWFKMLDIGRLNLGNAGDCILGQLYGAEAYETEHDAFDLGVDDLFGVGTCEQDMGADHPVIHFGFDLPLEWTEGLEEGYSILTAAWKFQILSRSAS